MIHAHAEAPGFLSDPRLQRLLGGSPIVLSSGQSRHLRVYRSLLDHAFRTGLWWGDVPIGLTRRKVRLADILS